MAEFEHHARTPRIVPAPQELSTLLFLPSLPLSVIFRPSMMSGNLIAPLGPPSATPLRPAAAAACSGPVAERNISLEITFEGEPHSKYKGMYKDVKNEMETASEREFREQKRGKYKHDFTGD